MRYKRKKLSVNFIFAAIISILLIATACFYVHDLKQMIQNDNYDFLEDIANQNAETVNQKLTGDIRMLKSLAYMLGTYENLDIQKWIDEFENQELFSQFQRIGFIFPDGTGYAQDVNGIDFSDRDYFKRAIMGEPVISDILVDKATGLYSFTYAVPVYHDDRIVYVLAAVVNMDIFQKTLLEEPFIKDGYSYLINNDSSIVLYSTGLSGDLAFENIFDYIHLSDQAKDNMLKNMPSGKSGRLQYSEDGKSYFLTYVPLGINDWYIVSVLPASTVLQRSNSILRMTAVTGIIVFAIILFYTLNLSMIRARSRKELYQLAYFDKLTGLYNKNGFLEHAPGLCSTGRDYAYCIMDIKRFHAINDRFGYDQGDELLKYIAGNLIKECAEFEIVSRFSADKFHMLLTYENKELLEKRLFCIASDINNYSLSIDSDYQIHFGFGVCLITDKRSSLAAVGDMAQTALYTIKELHSTSIYFHDEILKSRENVAQEIESAMIKAIKNEEFKVYMQPKYSLDTGRIASAETLVRWFQPEKGMIPPNDFIPLFEKNGFIAELDLYMFAHLCLIIKKWLASGLEPVPISINQSRVNLFTPGYMDKLITLFQSYGIPARYIIIEITESAFFNDMEAINSIVDTFHRFGFLVSMDDFGSGYSSLNMLQDIFLDEFKIDKNFFHLSNNEERGQKIVRNIITMAQDLKINVVAEGVENAEQAAFLKEAGCQQVQGYYYAKPMHYSEFEDILFKR